MSLEIESEEVNRFGWGRDVGFGRRVALSLQFLHFHEFFLCFDLQLSHQLVRKTVKHIHFINLCYLCKLTNPTSFKPLLLNIFQLPLEQFVQSTKVEEPSGLPQEVGSPHCVQLIQHGVVINW